jgi:CheY-like chemotaxis protein
MRLAADMSKQPIKLLVVDDEEFNRDLLQELLSGVGYSVILAEDGVEALEILDSGQHHFAAILLDRMMPRLDGMGLLVRLKADSRFKDVPVIFQTAIDHPAEIAQGIKAGAFYYLVKPVDEKVLYAIVQSATDTFLYAHSVRYAVSQEQAMLAAMLQQSDFSLRTLFEARTLAAALSAYYPQPQRVFLGISELLINAVEHGNLGISYAEKTRLMEQGSWEDEIDRRLSIPEYAEKKVKVKLERQQHEIRLTIIDNGNGFNCGDFMQMSPERAFDPNGRGIAMSKMSFDTLEYKGGGNEVMVVVKL